MDPLNIFATIGKVISVAKGVKTVSDTVAENSEERRRQREAERKWREQEETMEKLRTRSIFETAFMYILGAAVGGYLSGMGLGGFILVCLFMIGQYSNLKELEAHGDVKRELVLTTIVAVFCVFRFLAA